MAKVSFKPLERINDADQIKNARCDAGFTIQHLDGEKVKFGTFFQRGPNPLDLMVQVLPEKSKPFIMMVGNIDGRKVVKVGDSYTIKSQDGLMWSDPRNRQAEIKYDDAPEEVTEESTEE